MTQLRVAYVLLRFPRLTETFVAEEIRGVQMRGVDFAIYSLLPSQEPLVHPVSQQLLPWLTYAPGFFSWPLWAAQLYYLLKAPTKYFGLLATILKQPAPHRSFLAKRVDVFLKGVWLARRLQRAPVDLVHTHFAWLSAVAGVVVNELLGIPFTVTAHAYDIYSERNDLLGLACRRAQRILTISEVNRKAILAAVPGLEPERVKVLHCGIDLDCFQLPPARTSSKPLRIISVGSLLPKKGHEFLIRACGELQAQHVDFQCVIAGSGHLERPLAALIHELGLDGKIALAGAKPQQWIRDSLAKSDLFVLASVTADGGDRDGIPVAIMEAMAMGVPVISTRLSGIPELVRDGETGLLAPERDPQQLAAAIVRLASDEPLRQRLAKNARDLVSSEYNITKNTDVLETVFRQAIQFKGAAMGSTV